MFRTDLVARSLPVPDLWQLEYPLVWESPEEIIVIPPGFLTDLASIPRAFQWLVPVNGHHRRPAVLHDYLYVIQDRSRAEADRLFLDAMESIGTRWSQRRLMHTAVRSGGWWAWGRSGRAKAADEAEHMKVNGLAR